MAKVFFHVDLDAFFASVEQRDRPELRGRPVIIGALPGHRGVVAACSYEARTFGVRSAMPISFAYRRCPDAVYLPVRMERYQEMSRSVMALFDAYSPDVVQISIDEATLDMSGTRRLFGPPVDAARRLKERVRAETGLTISVGIAPNRYLAKLASEFRKPDGLYEVLPGSEIEFIDQLELRNLWGVGKKTLEQLSVLGIRTIRELRAIPLPKLQQMVGMAGGRYLHDVVRGIDPGIYSQERRTHSISSETTFEHDTKDRDLLNRTMLDIAHQVIARLFRERVQAKTVHVKIRYGDFTTTTAQTTLKRPVASAEEIYSCALALFDGRWSGEPIRLIGAGVSANEEDQEPDQPELFDTSTSRQSRVEKAVLDIEEAGNRVVKASLLGKRRRWEAR